MGGGGPLDSLANFADSMGANGIMPPPVNNPSNLDNEELQQYYQDYLQNREYLKSDEPTPLDYILDSATDVLPIIGSIKSINETIDNPSAGNIASTGISIATDTLPFLKFLRGTRLISKGTNMVNNARQVSRSTGRSIGNVKREGQRMLTKGRKLRTKSLTLEPIKWARDEVIQRVVKDLFE